jgi:hypothetical protein
MPAIRYYATTNNRLATPGLPNSTSAGITGADQFGVGRGGRHLF